MHKEKDGKKSKAKRWSRAKMVGFGAHPWNIMSEWQQAGECRLLFKGKPTYSRSEALSHWSETIDLEKHTQVRERTNCLARALN